MTLIGNRPECRVSAESRVLSVECRDPEVLHASRSTFRLSCLTLPVLLLLSASPSLSLAASSTPYQSIVERNVFGLKPPPPPPDPETLKPPPPKLTLTGIMTIFGKKQALFKAPPTPAAPAKPGQQPEPPKDHSYILAEGQREDGITVLQIDDVAKTVKLDADGTIVNLTFSTNNTSTASSPGPGGIPSPTGIGGPNPAFQPGVRTIPRPLRIPGMGSSSATPVGNGTSAGMANAGTVGNMGAPMGGTVPPGMNFGGTPNYNSAPQQQALPTASYEEQIVAIEVERQRLKNSGSDLVNLMPPTVLTPQQNEQENTQPQQNPNQHQRTPFRPPGLPQMPQ